MLALVIDTSDGAILFIGHVAVSEDVAVGELMLFYVHSVTVAVGRALLGGISLDRAYIAAVNIQDKSYMGCGLVVFREEDEVA